MNLKYILSMALLAIGAGAIKLLESKNMEQTIQKQVEIQLNTLISNETSNQSEEA